MPRVDFSAMDEALADMEEIGMRGWRAKQAYINGEISLMRFEEILEEELSHDW